MKTLISIMFLVVFALIVIFGVLGLVGAILGLTFGAVGVVIGLVFKIIFSPLIFIIIAAFVVFRIFGRRAAK